MNFEENDADLSSAKKVAEVKLRQREIYRLASTGKREALLPQRRCATDVQDCRPTFENPLKMSFPTISAAVVASNKQKNISHHSYVYEAGSISDTSALKCDIASKSIQNKGVTTFEEKNSDLLSTKKADEMKFRRREIYRLISARKKEALLLQRRTNSLDLKGNTASKPTAFHAQSQCVIDAQIHCPASQKDNESHIIALSAGSDKQENISPLFYVYEVGSTSGATNSKCDMTSKNIQKKAHRQYRKGCANMNELLSEYVHLQTVPNCKFCGAKRFEYEPPGFCCNNGSIKLVSNQKIRVKAFCDVGVRRGRLITSLMDFLYKPFSRKRGKAFIDSLLPRLNPTSTNGGSYMPFVLEEITKRHIQKITKVDTAYSVEKKYKFHFACYLATSIHNFVFC